MGETSPVYAPPPPRQGVDALPPVHGGEPDPGDPLAPSHLTASVETFTHAISHDLRAPLRAIDTYAQALAEDYGHRLPDQAREFVSRIRLAGRAVEDRVDALLRLSTLGHGALLATSTDLAPVAVRLIEDLERSEPTRQVVTHVAAPIQVVGDPALLGIALENLLTNAWKFTRTVPCARITVAGSRVGGELVVTVADNGIGFDMRHAPRLGVPFQRLHAAEAYEGIGIGLASARRIVERHGGRLWAQQSAPGEGATFCMALPVVPTP